MKKNTLNQLKKVANDIEVKWGEFFVKSVPALPVSAKELLVEWLWLLVVIGVVLLAWSLIGVLTLLLGLGSLIPGGMMFGSFIWVGMLIYFAGMVIVLYLNIKALPHLKTRQRLGWQYLYWSLLVSILSELLSLNLIGALLSGLIGFYFLFQIKEYYK